MSINTIEAMSLTHKTCSTYSKTPDFGRLTYYLNIIRPTYV